MEFNVPNHDDIFKLIELVKDKQNLSPEMAARFVVGLKLIGEVILEERRHPLFSELKLAMMEIMKIVKGKK